MTKAEVDNLTLSEHDIQFLIGAFGFSGLITARKLHGGYSGTNYRVEAKRAPSNYRVRARGLTGPFVAVLKICHSYGADEVGAGRESSFLVASPRLPSALLHRVALWGGRPLSRCTLAQ